MIHKLSPAKINLHLKVLRKREDGYHDLATLMQLISLYDEMTFTLTACDISLKCPGSNLPENENNIVYRAAEAVLSRLSYEGGVSILIDKKIPIAAGLGGGSSNAATTMVTLNELLGNRLTTFELLEMGRKLGADVPFFIFGKTAWAFGIGDKLEAAPAMPPLWYVLVNPGFAVPTKEVYENLNLGLTKEAINYSIPRFRTGGDLIDGLRNDLEEVTLNLHPLLNQLKELLVGFGALGALMSGSGPTVFGVFTDKGRAQQAKDALSVRLNRGFWLHLAHSI